MQFLHRDSYLFPDHPSTPLEGAGRRLVQIAFLGKGVPPADGHVFGRVVAGLLPEGVEPSWVRQVHSADVVEAEPGACGPADALVTRRPALALTVVTADCVPVLLAGLCEAGQGQGEVRAELQIAAVHAGWRGVAANIVLKAAGQFAEPPRTAWIGPAISGDVYEVGPEVAEQVVAASDETVLSRGANGREHVDLRRAVEIQLQRLGVEDVRQVERCTFQDDSLWSYRRDGEKAGRNLSLIWMEP